MKVPVPEVKVKTDVRMTREKDTKHFHKAILCGSRHELRFLIGSLLRELKKSGWEVDLSADVVSYQKKAELMCHCHFIVPYKMETVRGIMWDELICAEGAYLHRNFNKAKREIEFYVNLHKDQT